MLCGLMDVGIRVVLLALLLKFVELILKLFFYGFVC